MSQRTRKPITFDTVREMTRALPRVEEGTAYGSPALRVGGKLFTCIAINKSADPDSLVVLLGFDQRDELIAAEPDIYYTTPHYVNYPSVLVRLRRVHPDALRDLLRMAHQFVSAKARRPRMRASRAKPGA
jgi:hypothetical protein